MNELYEFLSDSGNWRYTPLNRQVVFGGETYLPEAIHRSAVDKTSEIGRQRIEITIPIGNEFGEGLVKRTVGNSVSLRIWRSSDSRVLWAGRVLGTSIRNNRVSLSCDPIFTLLSRPGNRISVGVRCRHMLYSAACGVDKSLYQDSGAIVSVSGRIVSIPGIGEDDAYYKNGQLYCDGENRLILKRVGDLFYLNYPLSPDKVSVVAEVYPGCNKSGARVVGIKANGDCIGKFDNMLRFGGNPVLTSTNPFENGIAIGKRMSL